MLKKSFGKIMITAALLCFGCAKSEVDSQISLIGRNSVVSGEKFQIKYKTKNSYESVYAELVDDKDSIVEAYGLQNFDNSYNINRIINTPISSNSKYLLRFSFIKDESVVLKDFPLNIEPSVIITSMCHTQSCESLTGNILATVPNILKIKTFKIATKKIVYDITTPYDSYSIEHNFRSPVDYDYLENLVLQKIPEDVGFYIAVISVRAYDEEGVYAETMLPFKVVRPIEIKHFGKYELAETYEPVPVTGCIPGTVGSNVQYSESESETRQNSVSININKSWSDSFSQNQTQSVGEGINVSETQGTVNSSSMSESETQSESYTSSSSQSESSNISFNTSDGESWSWSLGETNSETQGQTQGQNTNTSINGSTTVGVSGEGSLPFLAKASGKVEVSAGVSRGWGETSSESTSETNSTNRGYSTGGSTQNGKTFGSAQNDSRSHSLSGAYVLSSSSSNTISESSSLTSGRVWNMSESISNGNVVTEGNSESIAETIVSSSSSSTTFSYSGYIPRGRFGVFFRQTSRYVKLSEIITYDANGFPRHAGFIMMNSWAWAPELSVSNSCEDAIISSLPKAECVIPPCGE